MIWRTGTKNPHTLYLDEGDVSIPQGFIMAPGAARKIVEVMNATDPGAPAVNCGIKRWVIDAPSNSQYHECSDGEWCAWDDVSPVLMAYAGRIADLERQLARREGK
jgi:hypothetical protein